MKGLLVVYILIFIGFEVFGQGKLTDEKRKEFDAQKVAFFTQELDLSPAEAAVFWPLYNEMQKKKKGIEGQIRKGNNEVNVASGLTEEKYAEAVGKTLELEEDLLEVKREYYRKMLTVLPAPKVWKLGDAERKFHRQLFDKLRRGVPAKK